MMPGQSGSMPYRFTYRDDLHVLPAGTQDAEVNLHGTFAEDRSADDRVLYYGMPGKGLVRIEADMRVQTLMPLPDPLQTQNIHSTRLVTFNGEKLLVLTANDAGLVAMVTLDGDLKLLLDRPDTAPYIAEDVRYVPTDTLLIDDTLYVTDGYGANVISAYDLRSHTWTAHFGSKNTEKAVDGQFGTAHGIALLPDDSNFIIADRYHSRLQVHGFDGVFVASHGLPDQAWPCFIDFIEWQGRQLAVIPNLYDSNRERAASIYVLDASTFEILSIIRPKDELGVGLATHMHNVTWHVHNDELYLICQAWNPGYYFVLACES